MHGDEGLRHHRHIDDDAVAFAHAFVGEHGGEGFDLVKKLAEGEGTASFRSPDCRR